MDPIERQDALDEIRRFSGYLDEDMINRICIGLNRLLPAQPEVVRCKDCKYCDRGIDEDGNPFLKCLGWAYGGTQEADFCSHAERTTEYGKE